MVASIGMKVMSMPMFSFTQFFDNIRESASKIGGAFVMALGIIMIIVAGWQIAKGLIGHGKTQTNWFIVIALMIVGGIFLGGGITMLTTLSQNLGDAAQGLGEGQIIDQILPHIGTWLK